MALPMLPLAMMAPVIYLLRFVSIHRLFLHNSPRTLETHIMGQVQDFKAHPLPPFKDVLPQDMSLQKISTRTSYSFHSLLSEPLLILPSTFTHSLPPGRLAGDPEVSPILGKIPS
ncbi:hypothetical protein M405DRAFT_591250 [Rhizopogon salebrosus TDB-379]|nr:hypothetical protein M405DRAFT_591250 [Rhizopogon salebrosus TDB-379]